MDVAVKGGNVGRLAMGFIGVCLVETVGRIGHLPMIDWGRWSGIRVSRVAAAALLGLGVPGPDAGSSVVDGVVAPFASPNWVEERCVVRARTPGAIYREADLRQETVPFIVLRSTAPFVHAIAEEPRGGEAAEAVRLSVRSERMVVRT